MDKINLREKFPLSNKKYWKKLTSSLISKLIFLGIFFLGIILFNAMKRDSLSDMWPFFSGIIFVLKTLMGLVLLHFLYRIWYEYVYIKKYYYSSDDKFLTIKKGVFAPTEIHVQYQKIQDVYVDQSLLDRIFGIYDVHISSATITSGIEAHIHGVEKENAEGLKEFLLNKIKNKENENFVKKTGEIKESNPSGILKEIKFDFEISSKVFSLSRKWFIRKIILSFLNSAGITLIAGILLISPDGSTPSVKDSAGLSNELFISISVIFFLVFFIAFLIRVHVWSKNYNFSFLSDFIEYEDGFISLNKRNMPYKNVQDIQISQDLWDRILGLYSISIQNASLAQDMRTGGKLDEIVIQSLSKEDSEKIANELKRVIFGKINPNNSGL